jgi:hypothetical protein
MERMELLRAFRVRNQGTMDKRVPLKRRNQEERMRAITDTSSAPAEEPPNTAPPPPAQGPPRAADKLPAGQPHT